MSAGSGEETISAALQRYYAAHGLPPDGGASDPVFHVKMGPLTFPLPNPPARRRAVLYHDVNHILTGYNTVFSEGEVEIAAFEVAAGCGPFAIAWLINVPMMLIGLVINSRATMRAWSHGRRSGSIYGSGLERDALARMTVGEVRARVGVSRA